MNYQKKQAHNLAKMQPTSVFLQPVRVNPVSFAQQTRSKFFFVKKSFFFFGEREYIIYQISFFFRRNPRRCYNFYCFLNDTLVFVCDLQPTIVGKSIFLLLSKFYRCPSLFRNLEGFCSWCSFLEFPYVFASGILSRIKMA